MGAVDLLPAYDLGLEFGLDTIKAAGGSVIHRIMITVKSEHGEAAFTEEQATKEGRPTRSGSDLLNCAVAAARAWIRSNEPDGKDAASETGPRDEWPASRGATRRERDGDEMLTIDDVCELLIVSKSTAYRLIRSGQLAAHKNPGPNGSLRIPRKALDEFMRRR